LSVDCGLHKGKFNPDCPRCAKLNRIEFAEPCQQVGYPYPLCPKAHETQEHRSNLIRHLVDKWCIDDAERVMEEYGLQVVWNVAFRQRHAQLAKLDKPSGFFISQCRIAVKS